MIRTHSRGAHVATLNRSAITIPSTTHHHGTRGPVAQDLELKLGYRHLGRTAKVASVPADQQQPQLNPIPVSRGNLAS